MVSNASSTPAAATGVPLHTRLLAQMLSQVQRRTAGHVLRVQAARMASSTSSSAASSGADAPVVFRQEGSARVVTLNRPRALNALNLDMCQLLLPKLKQFEQDPNISLVILTGAGDKAFCAGGDVKAMVMAAKEGHPELGRAFFKHEYTTDYAIGTLSKPHVAIIDGITMGGGVGLSVHGPVRVATENTVFAMPETAIGLYPDVGGTHFLPRLEGELGMFLALTGHRLKGKDVLHAGIATHFVPHERIQHLIPALGNLTIDQAADPAMLHTTIDNFSGEYEPFTLAPHLDMINRVFALDSVEAIIDALGKESSPFAHSILKALRRASPTSLKVTYRQVRMGAKLTLSEAFRMEYRVSTRFMDRETGHDFLEGVTALLIDKGRQAKWHPASLEDVSAEYVNRFFEPLGDEADLDLQHQRTTTSKL